MKILSKWLPSRKVVGVLAGALGVGGGAALDEKVMSLVSQKLLKQHLLESHVDDGEAEVQITPQCYITVKIDDDFLKSQCERLK